MRLDGKVVVVTGGASGIGAALCRRFAAERPAGVVVADLTVEGSQRTADEVVAAGAPALAVACDVAVEADVQRLVAEAEAAFGPVDLLVQNAGIGRAGGADAPDADWADSWAVNVMAHVYGVRAVLPSMLARGSGYLLHTCSAAGLLTNPGAAPYTVTKHAAVAFAEWLAITHGEQGIRVSALCPQGVATPMLLGGLGGEEGGIGRAAATAVSNAGGLLSPEAVADAVVEGIDAERFLILPHPEVALFEQRRAADHDRWISGVRKLSRPS